MAAQLLRLFVEPLVSTAARFAGAIPTLAAALLLVLVGMFCARLARALAEGIMARLRVDDYTSRVGINEVLLRLGLGKSPTFALGFVVHWFILVVFIVSAANALNIPTISELLERFVQVLPALVAALLILFGGLLFGRLLAQVMRNATAANSIRGGGALAAAAQVVTVGAAGVVALEQVGVRPQIMISAVQILFGSVGLALAIAFGFGAKDMAAEYLRELTRPR